MIPTSCEGGNTEKNWRFYNYNKNNFYPQYRDHPITKLFSFCLLNLLWRILLAPDPQLDPEPEKAMETAEQRALESICLCSEQSRNVSGRSRPHRRAQLMARRPRGKVLSPQPGDIPYLLQMRDVPLLFPYFNT